MPDTQETMVSARVPRWVPRYISLMAAKLDKPKWQVITDALRYHRAYYNTTGIITDGEVEKMESA